jgi:hypothetical protein
LSKNKIFAPTTAPTNNLPIKKLKSTEIIAENKLKNKVSSLEDYAIVAIPKKIDNAMGARKLNLL